MAISSLVATRHLHGCDAREPLDLIAGKCAQGIAGAAASGWRGTSMYGVWWTAELRTKLVDFDEFSEAQV